MRVQVTLITLTLPRSAKSKAKKWPPLAQWSRKSLAWKWGENDNAPGSCHGKAATWLFKSQISWLRWALLALAFPKEIHHWTPHKKDSFLALHTLLHSNMIATWNIVIHQAIQVQNYFLYPDSSVPHVGRAQNLNKRKSVDHHSCFTACHTTSSSSFKIWLANCRARPFDVTAA